MALDPRRLIAPLGSLALMVAPAAADDLYSQVGVRVGYNARLERPYVGGEVLLPLGGSWYLDGNLEYVHRPASQYVTINMDLHYAFTVRRRAFAWAGAGLGLISEDPDGPREPTTNDGVGNLLVGVGYDGPATPYIQVKMAGRRNRQVSFGLGVRF